MIARDISIDTETGKVQAVTGPRRSGKSSLMKISIQSLIHNGLDWGHVCYISFEDERLRKDNYNADLLLQAFRELHPENALLRNVYFFLDEIQYLPGWEFFINRVYESISRNIVISGSNSKILHTNVASVLRGRGIVQEVLPLSFAEFLRFKDISYQAWGPQKSVVIAAFQEYLLWGGYPEIALSKPALKRTILQEYFNTVIYRDILEQKPGVTNYLRYLLHRIATNTGKTLSLRKIHHELKSRGYAVSQDSIYQASDLAESVYLFRRISKYDHSLIKRENSDKKCYFIDSGLLHAINGDFSDNIGALFENMVFWQLYRVYGNIYSETIFYYKDLNNECDFIVARQEGIPLPVQVTTSLKDESVRNREIKGLLKACRFCEVKKGFIITLEEEETYQFSGIEIEILPAWKWCSENRML